MKSKKYMARAGQTLLDHLNTVADRCSEYCAKFGLGSIGYTVGLLHDFGKYMETWQIYLESSILGESPAVIPHAIYGAAILHSILSEALNGDAIGKLFLTQLVNAIYSHHNTMHDMFTDEDSSDGTTRVVRLDRKISECDYSSCLNEESVKLISKCKNMIDDVRIEFNNFVKSNIKDSGKEAFRIGFLSKMVYSSLVDADRSDAGGLYED